MNIETLISLGYYVSSVGFLVATYMTFNAYRKSVQSGLKTVLFYLFLGTGGFFLITVFQKLVEMGLYNISDESQDVWWHFMFFLAMFSFYFGFKSLAKLGNTDQTSQNTAVSTNKAQLWGYFSLFLFAVIFIIPNWAETAINAYTSSRVAELGAHHFIAFVMAGVVGAYLFSAKLFLGQIGKAIASPMIIAIWALALQHFWELLTESWKVFEVTSENIEGVEKIFLIIASICVIVVSLRLRSFSTPTAKA